MRSSEMAEVKLSPLDQIRQAEAEIARRVAYAREAAGQLAVEAQAEANELQRQAREAGHREGRKRYREILSQAQVEVDTILEQARSQAEGLHFQGQDQMDAIVWYAVEIVVGLQGEECNT